MPEITEATPDRKPWLRCDKEARIKTLNLQSVCDDTSIHVNLRNWAARLIEGNSTGVYYQSVGSFFYGLPNFAVADLYQMQEGFEDDYSTWLVSKELDEQFKLKNLTTLAFLLAYSEGMPDLDAKVVQEALPNLCTLIKLESASRKGLATVNHKEFSLFDADKHKPGYFNKKAED